MRVESNVLPVDREYLQGKVLVNFNVTQETINDEVRYVYEQLRFEPWYSEEAIEKEVAKRKEELKVKKVSPRQARIALLRAGMLDAINAAVASNPEWAISWEFAAEVERSNPIIAAATVQLGKTDADIDQLFIDASKL